MVDVIGHVRDRAKLSMLPTYVLQREAEASYSEFSLHGHAGFSGVFESNPTASEAPKAARFNFPLMITCLW